ncbi:MAG TPA: hypothetical protein VMG99_06550 [Thermoplasmata archaeon]|nr:hypothetical protein [Thermoplasmata archaeon]
MAAATAGRRRRGVPPLTGGTPIPLPVGQSVDLTGPQGAALLERYEAALRAEGFVVEPTLHALLGSDGGVPPTVATVVAERRLRRAPIQRPTRVTIAVLLGCGIALGALDAYVVGAVVVAFPWAAAGAAGAAILWARYGRVYESEVVALAIGRVEGAGGPRTVLGWSAGRVRSTVFGGARTESSVVDCPVPLMEALGRIVRGPVAAPTVPT